MPARFAFERPSLGAPPGSLSVFGTWLLVFFDTYRVVARRKSPSGPSTTTFSKVSVKSAVATACAERHDFAAISSMCWLFDGERAERRRSSSGERLINDGVAVGVGVGVGVVRRLRVNPTAFNHPPIDTSGLAPSSTACAHPRNPGTHGGAATAHTGRPSFLAQRAAFSVPEGTPAWTMTTASASATST